MFQFDITVDARCGPAGESYMSENEFASASGYNVRRRDQQASSSPYLDLSGNSEMLRLSLASTLVLPTM